MRAHSSAAIIAFFTSVLSAFLQAQRCTVTSWSTQLLAALDRPHIVWIAGKCSNRVALEHAICREGCAHGGAIDEAPGDASLQVLQVFSLQAQVTRRCQNLARSRRPKIAAA